MIKTIVLHLDGSLKQSETILSDSNLNFSDNVVKFNVWEVWQKFMSSYVSNKLRNELTDSLENFITVIKSYFKYYCGVGSDAKSGWIYVTNSEEDAFDTMTWFDKPYHEVEELLWNDVLKTLTASYLVGRVSIQLQESLHYHQHGILEKEVTETISEIAQDCIDGLKHSVTHIVNDYVCLIKLFKKIREYHPIQYSNFKVYRDLVRFGQNKGRIYNDGGELVEFSTIINSINLPSIIYSPSTFDQILKDLYYSWNKVDSAKYVDDKYYSQELLQVPASGNTNGYHIGVQLINQYLHIIFQIQHSEYLKYVQSGVEHEEAKKLSMNCQIVRDAKQKWTEKWKNIGDRFGYTTAIFDFAYAIARMDSGKLPFSALDMISRFLSKGQMLRIMRHVHEIKSDPTLSSKTWDCQLPMLPAGSFKLNNEYVKIQYDPSGPVDRRLTGTVGNVKMFAEIARAIVFAHACEEGSLADHSTLDLRVYRQNESSSVLVGTTLKWCAETKEVEVLSTFGNKKTRIPVSAFI